MPLLRTLERIADVFSPLVATSSLDVAANREHLRSGNPARIRSGLSHLAELGPRARAALPEIRTLVDAMDPEIATLAEQAHAAVAR